MIEVCKEVLDIEGQIMSCESYHIKFVSGFSWQEICMWILLVETY